MPEVRRVREVHSNVVDDTSLRRSRRASDRAIYLLVGAFACLALVVLGFAVVRSRMLPPKEVELAVGNPTSRPHAGFRVVRILDGDTLIVLGEDDIELTLRLAGIDAPEKDQAFGNEATEFLERLLQEQIIHLDDVKREKYGRVLAQAYLNSEWVDLKIVQHGYAWVYPGSNSKLLRAAESKARAEKIGLWASGTPSAPWEWRKQGK